MATSNNNKSTTVLVRPEGAVSLKEALEIVHGVAVGAQLPVILWGPPGVGKTKGLTDLFVKKLGYDELRVIVLSMSDPTDIKGVPHVVTKSVMRNGETREEHFTDWAADTIFAVPTGKKIAFFFDEIANAAPSVVAPAQKLIHEGVVGNVDIRGCPIVAASNDTTHRAGTNVLMAPVANRFVHVDVWPEIGDVADYGMASGWNSQIVAYLRMRQKYPAAFGDVVFRFDPRHDTRAFPTPRTIEYVAKIMDAGLEETLRRIALQGAIGQAWMNDFETFLSVYKNMPPIDAIIDGSYTNVPTEPNTLFALNGALIATLLNHHSGGLSKAKLTAEVDNVIAYTMGMEPEFAVQLMTDVTMAKDSTLVKNGTSLQGLKNFGPWMKKYSKFYSLAAQKAGASKP